MVGHSQWSNAFAHIFSHMHLNSEKNLYITTGSHALSLYLRRKTNLFGQQRYVIELSDPNRTIVYKRYVASSVGEIKSLKMDKFLPKHLHDFYYGKFTCSTFTSAPDGLHTCGSISEVKALFDEEEGRGRTVKEFLSEKEKRNHGRRFFWLRNNLPIASDMLKEQLAALAAFPSNKKKMEFLAAKELRGYPARYYGLIGGVLKKIREDNIFVVTARHQGEINNEEFIELLQGNAPRRENPFKSGLQNGHIETCKEHGKAVLYGYSENWIKEAQFEISPEWLRQHCRLEMVAANIKRDLLLHSERVVNRADGSEKQQPAIDKYRSEFGLLLNDILLGSKFDSYKRQVQDDHAPIESLAKIKELILTHSDKKTQKECRKILGDIKTELAKVNALLTSNVTQSQKLQSTSSNRRPGGTAGSSRR